MGKLQLLWKKVDFHQHNKNIENMDAKEKTNFLWNNEEINLEEEKQPAKEKMKVFLFDVFLQSMLNDDLWLM